MIFPFLRRLGPALFAPIFLCSSAMAGDWPQILGPQRSGVAEGESLVAWEKSNPKTVWSTQLGQGYAGPAVLGDKVIAFHRLENSEWVEAFSRQDGESLWRTSFPATYRGGIDPDIGPRCVPLIAGDLVYLLGAGGDAHAVKLTSGEKVWSRSLSADYDAPDGYFGAGSTPILIEGKLLINVGGEKAGIVALDAASGRTLWKATEEDASYSAPVAIQHNDKTAAAFVTRLKFFILDPATGKVLLELPFGKRGPTVNAASPLVLGDRIFLSASYGIGAKLIDVANLEQPKTIWENDEALSSQYNTSVYRGGHLYGIHGREDIPPAALRCVNAATGKVAWSKDDFGVAHVIAAGDKLLILKVSGELVLAKISSAKYEELAQAQVFTDAARALPALSGGMLFVRTNRRSGGGKLYCVEVGKRE